MRVRHAGASSAEGTPCQRHENICMPLRSLSVATTTDQRSLPQLQAALAAAKSVVILAGAASSAVGHLNAQH